MSFLTQRITWQAWKFGVLKWSMAAFGVIVGANFAEFWLEWQPLIWVFFGVTATISSAWALQSLYGVDPQSPTTA